VTSTAIALREERPVVREALLDEHPKLEVVGAVANGASARFALGAILLAEAGWLATVGYFAVAIIR
jgi:hypothetical protein